MWAGIRILWWLVAGFYTCLFIAAIPPSFEVLQQICSSDICETASYFTLTSAQAQELAVLRLSPEGYAAIILGMQSVLALVCVALGLLIFLRRSDERIAYLSSLAMILLGTFLVPGTSGALVHANPWLVPVVKGTYVWGNWLFPVLIFLIPDGQFVPRWSGWVAWIWPALVTITLVLTALQVPAQWYQLSERIVGVVSIPYMAVGLGCVIYRYRRGASPIARQQLKWIMFGATGILFSFIVSAIFRPFPVSTNVGLNLGLRLTTTALSYLGLLALPFGLTFAILRHRLWDIDLVISRMLVYGALTIIIGATYAILVSAIGVLLQAEGNIVAGFLGVAVAALLLNPVRERLQRIVNRLMFGQRDEPYAVLAQFGRQLEDTLDLATLLPTIVETIKNTLKLPYVDLVIGMAPSPGLDKITTFPLNYKGDVVGHLFVTPREGELSLTTRDRRLLEDLARQAGVALHAAQITDELQQARERLVIAREEERRRLRRDLHDGIGPALAAIAAQTEAARELIRMQPDQSAALLDEVVLQSRETIADIRRVVYNLRPPALDDLGLVGAIQAQTEKLMQSNGLRVVMQVSTLPVLPAAVEVAAFRILQEALVNVSRHAHASHCSVKLSVEGIDMLLQIEDDGCGFDTEQAKGVGMASMHERARELGGTCSVISGINRGTQVYVCLPLTSSEKQGDE